MANVNDHRKLRSTFKVRLQRSEDKKEWLKLVCQANEVYWHPTWDHMPIQKVADTIHVRLHLRFDHDKPVELPMYT